MPTQIIQYTAARRELELCATLKDTKIALDKTAALAFYAKQNNDNEMEKWVAEIKLRARRKIGEYSSKLENAQGKGKDTDASPLPTAGKKSEQLKAAGVSTSVANRCEKLAEIPKDKFEAVIAKTDKPITYKDVEKSVMGDGTLHSSSGENDWYTPSEYIESARFVMGSIDTDPASSEFAQRTVGAARYYTEETDGLDKIWTGNVWMNPPYSMPEIKQFVDRLLSSDFDEYIVLTNNSSDTSWFHDLLKGSHAMCFTKGRVGFINRAGDKMATRQGQTFFYSGSKVELFASEFSQYGAILNDYS